MTEQPNWDSINKAKRREIQIGQSYNLACEDFKGQIGSIKPAYIAERTAFHYKMLQFLDENIEKIATKQDISKIGEERQEVKRTDNPQKISSLTTGRIDLSKLVTKVN